MQVTETLSDGLQRGYTVVLPLADLDARRNERLTTLGVRRHAVGARSLDLFRFEFVHRLSSLHL